MNDKKLRKMDVIEIKIVSVFFDFHGQEKKGC